MGINKVETSVCLRYKKEKKNHTQKKSQVQDMLLDAGFKSINVLHQLSLDLFGFCVLCYST